MPSCPGAVCGDLISLLKMLCSGALRPGSGPGGQALIPGIQVLKKILDSPV